LVYQKEIYFLILTLSLKHIHRPKLIEIKFLLEKKD